VTVGAPASGRLAIRRARIGKLRIDRLIVTEDQAVFHDHEELRRQDNLDPS
jgi:hypothetical protein